MGEMKFYYPLLIIEILFNNSRLNIQTSPYMLFFLPKNKAALLRLPLCFIIFMVFLNFPPIETTQIIAPNTQTTTTGTNSLSPIPNWLSSSESQLARYMSDSYNYFLTPAGNKVWVCAMNLAWNQMRRQFLQNQKARFAKANQIQKKIVQNFNMEKFTLKQLSEDSYYVSSGYGPNAQSRINFEVRQKFPQIKFAPLTFIMKDEDFIAYSYLQKKFKFLEPFSSLNSFKFKNKTVEGFESTTSKQRNQLYYKYYNNPNDFLVGIKTKDQNEQILLLKTNRTEINNFKMEKILHLVQLYDQLPNLKLNRNDKFRMPVLNFDYTRQYIQMEGLSFENPGFEKYVISGMIERLKLKIDRSGVEMMNEAVIIIARAGFFLEQKFFYLNSDFWVILKQKNKKPYLIIKVSCVKEQLKL